MIQDKSNEVKPIEESKEYFEAPQNIIKVRMGRNPNPNKEIRRSGSV
jgi:hypothetical protein